MGMALLAPSATDSYACTGVWITPSKQDATDTQTDSVEWKFISISFTPEPEPELSKEVEDFLYDLIPRHKAKPRNEYYIRRQYIPDSTRYVLPPVQERPSFQKIFPRWVSHKTRRRES